jgi:hypothetical protein
MPNLVNVWYEQTRKSLSVNKMGMPEMQARVLEAGKSQHLLVLSAWLRLTKSVSDDTL